MKALMEVEINYFCLKMKDGKYHIYKKTTIVSPKISVDDIETVDTLEEATEKIEKLMDK